MTPSSRTLARRLTAALLAGALALSACGGDDDDGSEDAGEASTPTVPTSEMTLVLDWTPNTNHAGIYLAEANGWYDAAGIDLEIIQPGDGGSLQAVATGNAEIAISVQEQIVPARASGVPVVSIGAIIADNTSSMMALASSDIETPADLAGHRYGGFGGQLETELIDRLVECDGGDPAAVEYVEVGNTDYRVGLETGAFDFVWIFDGWDKIRLEQAGVEVNTIPFIDYVDCIPNWYTPLIATSEALIAEQPDRLAAFMAVTTQGYLTAIDDPAAAADALLAAAPELDEELVRASAEYLSGQYAREGGAWGVQDPQVWEDFVAFLVDAGLLDETIDVEAAYTNEFLE